MIDIWAWVSGQQGLKDVTATIAGVNSLDEGVVDGLASSSTLQEELYELDKYMILTRPILVRDSYSKTA